MTDQSNTKTGEIKHGLNNIVFSIYLITRAPGATLGAFFYYSHTLAGNALSLDHANVRGQLLQGPALSKEIKNGAHSMHRSDNAAASVEGGNWGSRLSLILIIV